MQSQVTKQFHDHTIISLAVAGLAAAVAVFIALTLTVELPVIGGDQAAGERDMPIAYTHAEMGEGLLDASSNQIGIVSRPRVSTHLPLEAGEGFVDNVNVALLPVYVPDYFSQHQGEGLVDRINRELNGITSTTRDGLPDYFSPYQGEGLLDPSN